VKLLRKSINILNDSGKKLGGNNVEFISEKTALSEEKKEPTANELLLKEQLGFINKISYDIAKVTDNILS